MTREDILEKLLRGEITPEEGEIEASCLNVSLTEPDPQSFDPMQEESWNLPMVLAWIASKDCGSVRRLMDSYQAHCYVLTPLGNQRGWYRKPSNNIWGPLSYVRKLFGYGCKKAETVLRNALVTTGNDSLKATATSVIGGARSAISSAQWHDLEWFEHGTSVYTRKITGLCRSVHKDLLFARDRVTTIWQIGNSS